MGKLGMMLRSIKGYFEEFRDSLRGYEAGEESVYAVERLALIIA